MPLILAGQHLTEAPLEPAGAMADVSFTDDPAAATEDTVLAVVGEAHAGTEHTAAGNANKDNLLPPSIAGASSHAIVGASR